MTLFHLWVAAVIFGVAYETIVFVGPGQSLPR